MKRLIILIPFLLLSLHTEAQNAGFLFGRPTRKQLQKENEELKATLDSLQTLVDSFG